MPHAQGVKDFERVRDELVLRLTVAGQQIAGVADVVNAVHGNAGGGDDVGDMVLAVAADGVDHVLAAEEMFLGDDALVALAEEIFRAGEFEEGGRALLGVAQNLTPSLPALLSGLTTTRVPNSLCHRASSSALVASNCLAPRTPAALIVSIIVNLSRRAALSSVPLVGRPMASLSRSANSTPNSLPAKTATGSYA